MKKVTFVAWVAVLALCVMFSQVTMAQNVVVPQGDDIILQHSSGDAIIENQNGHVRIRHGGTINMIIRGNNRVGINESSPQQTLHVGGGIQSDAYILDTGIAAGGLMLLRSAGNEDFVMRNVSGALTFREAGVLLATFDGGDADFTGQVTVAVLQITGGSDLSEQFDIAAVAGSQVEPGSVVSIDAANPGDLMLSAKAYDRTVAGIVSGAGGLQPGMRMGQAGSIGSGEYPVALTGRVYCKADASQGAIVPGDLLTTSAVPGHAMKVLDHQAATGAIIGKAMTGLAQGEQGLVLVLVSLQ